MQMNTMLYLKDILTMKIFEICFSPCGGTKKVADIVAKEISASISYVDLCDRNSSLTNIKITNEDLAVIAMPSYGGLAPDIALERLMKINGNQARTILITVYGNRDYEDTLIELFDIAKKANFKVIGGISAIAQHSIVNNFAKDRPDTIDIENLKKAANKLKNKVTESIVFPGNRPYKKAGKSPIYPYPTKKCIKCLSCYENCPVGAIDKDTLKANHKICISCMRCVNVCQYNARKINPVMKKMAYIAIKKECSIRKEVELFE